MDESFWKFIEEHKHADPVELRLKYGKKDFPFPFELALTQIESRKHSKKLPVLQSHPRFIIPLSISGEQATAQQVAEWHSTLFDENEKVADLTAGLGMDSFAIAKKVDSLTAIEINPEIADALRYNSDLLGINNLSVITADSEEWVTETTETFTTIFIDPARRTSAGGRVYAFEDCAPDVVTLMDKMLQKSQRVIIKASPMLDVKAIVRQLPAVSRIYAVALNGEMKELLVEVTKNKTEKREFVALGIRGEQQHEFVVTESVDDWNWNHDISYVGNEKPQYIYEPDAAMMKLSPWSQLMLAYPDLRKADVSTHLFFSDKLYHDFPGRVFRNLGLLGKKETATGNVLVRNFPMTADQLRKKLKIKSTPESDYIIGLKVNGKPTILKAVKV